MRIKITGASGYIGSIISNELENKGYSVLPIKRSLLYGSTENLSKELSGVDGVIHLAGAPVLQRWTTKNKKTIYNSRVVTTQNIVKAIRHLKPENRPGAVISASAVGIYLPGQKHDESSNQFENGFLGKVVKDWEAAWEELPEKIHLKVFRLGVVLGREAATIKKMIIPFRLGAGGKIGHGNQSFPFVHEKDVAGAFAWAMENQHIEGVFNLVAPQFITNSDFTKALAHKLNRPAFLSVPSFALKLVFGRAASLLTESPEVEPKYLMNSGFRFMYGTIEEALNEILTKK